MTEGRRALVVTYGGGHANMTIPLIRELAQRGWSVTALGATTAGPQLRAAGIPAVGYRDLVGPGDERALADGERLAPSSHDPSTGIPLEESIAYLGLSYRDLAERVGEEEAGARWERWGRHALLPLGPMSRAIERWRPDAVVTTNSPKSERAALVVAHEMGIATLALEDCLGIRPGLFPAVVPPFRADRVCAPTSIATEHLIAQGTDAASVRITGNPAFDPLARISASDVDAVRARLGLRSARPAILVAGHAFTDMAVLGRMFARLAAAEADCDLLFRRHPSRRSADASAALAGAPGRARLADDVPVQPLLAAVAVLLTVASTTALEAILLGTPVIQLGRGTAVSTGGETADDLPLYRYGASVLAEDEDTVIRLVHDLLHAGAGDGLRRRAGALFPHPGDATRRVADELAAIAT